jgi:hypothetical protein
MLASPSFRDVLKMFPHLVAESLRMAAGGILIGIRDLKWKSLLNPGAVCIPGEVSKCRTYV